MGKTFSKVYVGDIVYILHNGGTLSEAKIIRYKRGVGISMVGIYTGDGRPMPFTEKEYELMYRFFFWMKK